MKKFTVLLLCIVLVFALCACAKKSAEPVQNESDGTDGAAVSGMVNPCAEYDSLDDINKAVGGNLMHPAVMGVSDEAYIVIDCDSYKIGEYRFKLNGFDYCFRCAEVTDDISGVYMGDEGTAFADGAAYDIQFNSDSEFKCARWFNDDMQYVLCVTDGGVMEQDTFENISQEMRRLSSGEV